MFQCNVSRGGRGGSWTCSPVAFRGKCLRSNICACPWESVCVSRSISYSVQLAAWKSEGANSFQKSEATFVCYSDDWRGQGILQWFKCQLVNKILAPCHVSFVLRQRILLKNETKMTNLTFPHLFIVCRVSSPFCPSVNHLAPDSSKLFAYLTSTMTYYLAHESGPLFIFN